MYYSFYNKISNTFCIIFDNQKEYLSKACLQKFVIKNIIDYYDYVFCGMYEEYGDIPVNLFSENSSQICLEYDNIENMFENFNLH